MPQGDVHHPWGPICDGSNFVVDISAAISLKISIDGHPMRAIPVGATLSSMSEGDMNVFAEHL